MGWLSGYSYRKKIPITGQSGAGTNYQISLEVHSGSGSDSNGIVYLAGHCTDFPNDVRFTDDDGTTELDHWIEPGTGTPRDFWIEVKDDLGNNQDFYIYYGKTGAASASNGVATFLFFDDGASDKSSSYTWRDLYSSGQVHSLEYESANNRYKVTQIGEDVNMLEISDLSSGSSYEIWAEIQFNVFKNTQFGICMRYTSSGVYWARVETHSSPDALKITKEPTPPNTSISDLTSSNYTGNVFSTGVYHRVAGRADGTTLRAKTENESKDISTTDSDYSSGTWGLFFGYGLLGSYPIFYFNLVVARKFNDPEPIVGTAGSEEKLSVKSCYIKGQTAGTPVSDSNSAHIKGSQSTSDSIEVYLKGKSIVIDSNGCYILGGLQTSDSKPCFIRGKATASSSKSIFLKTQEGISSSKPAFIKGKLSTVSSKDSYLKGIAGASDSNSCYIKGQDTSSDSQTAYIKGSSTIIDSIACYIKGIAGISGFKYCYIKGQSISSDSSPCYISGGVNVLDSQPAHISGITSTSDNKSCHIKGKSTSSDSKPCFINTRIVVDVTVGAGVDDGSRDDTGFNTSWETPVVGYFDSPYNDTYMFFRFTGITIKGEILTAYIELYGYSEETGTPELKVCAVDEDNPDAPTSAAEFDADPLTTEKVDWNSGFTTGYVQSPELKTVFQELVDSHTIENDAVIVQVRDNKGSGPHWWRIFAWDYNSGERPAKLHIEYTTKKASSKGCFIGGGSTASSSNSCFISGTVVKSSKSSYIKGKAIVSSYKSCFIGTLIYNIKSCFLKTEGRKYGPAAAHM